MAYELTPRDVITPPVRIAYANGLWEARVPAGSAPGTKAKFGCVLLLPPETKLEAFAAAIKAAMMDKWGKVIPLPAAKNPIKDAAEKDGVAGFDEGWHFINVSGTRQPAVVDGQLNPILDKDMLFSGCYVHAHLNAYAWDHPTGGKGVSFGLNSVQFVRTGERLGAGAVAPEYVFKPLTAPKSGAQGGGKTKAAPASDLDSMFS